MEEENQQQVKQKPKEPQRVTTKDPKKLEAGKRLAAINHKKREKPRREKNKCNWRGLPRGGGGGLHQWSEPILWNWGHSSCGDDRWSWLLHLSKQERSCNQRSQ